HASRWASEGNLRGAMAVPEKCAVLVVGGGPAGSYTASVLAREGINVTVLEADIFPRYVNEACHEKNEILTNRYHIGESMLPSLRNFLRFIDLETKFDEHGFIRKVSRPLNISYTDFPAAKGINANNSAWNVIRSEADGLIVTSISFEPAAAPATTPPGPGSPTQASWSQKGGTTGTIMFQYLVDATGRAGLMSTKYLKNREMNQSLKAMPEKGQRGENQPYFEALSDGSGWAWAIPLHTNSMSVGVVMDQDLMLKMKKEGRLSSQELYQAILMTTSIANGLLKNATLVSGIRSASDWSYNASSYAGLNWRIIGDAGCFIDPFFSSGIHLALTGGLSAAVTICAAERGHCTPQEAAEWHGAKIADSYNRFLLVVTSALKQSGDGEKPVLTRWDEDNFDRAFDIFQPVIQGAADLPKQVLPMADSARLLDFCTHAMLNVKDFNNRDIAELAKELGVPVATVNAYVQMVMKVQTRNETSDLEDFASDAVKGLSPNMIRGSLGLVKG
ncbi:FAD/NAD(P)-binding domain-containing protein, partial [Penicillium longicatenatum]|uniref:FAD/NAD(P)-binding domain-containing protein n=1 Tax=Penicillium longicatenatum TaxID=1561947 RepID=UPI0025478673